MITGIVNSALEATIAFSVQDVNGQTQTLDAVIDTGFNGFLTLPPTRVSSLGASWLYRGQAVLADGSVQVFDVYTVTVIWDGQPRRVEVEAVDAAPLVGMALLQKHDLRIEIVPSGTVLITPRP